MILNVLSCRDRGPWHAALAKIPEAMQSPHFMPEYYRLFEERREGRAICFVGADGDRVIVYPALLNSINELGYDLPGSYYDLQGAYGYNGPVSNCRDEDFLSEFSNSLLRYYRESGIIAEFIRFCPLIGNQGLLKHIEPVHALDNVLLDLSRGLDWLWKNSFDNGVRKAIRKAAKANLDFKIMTGGDVGAAAVDDFLHIYHETMSRNQAAEYYFFSPSFIQELFATMPGQTLLAFVLHDGVAISSELVLRNGRNAYGFLGGTLSSFYALNPNSYLRHELLTHLIAAGIQSYSIGGGKEQGDSVFLYKKSFSKNMDSKFYIGKCIHDEEIYHGVVAQWSQKYPEKALSHEKILLKYRY